MDELTKTFKALTDPNRVRILKMLENRSLCVCEITEILDLATSTVSKHLSILREAGFITYEKDGKWVNYRLVNGRADTYAAELLDSFNDWLEEDPVIQSDKRQTDQVDREEICGI